MKEAQIPIILVAAGAYLGMAVLVLWRKPAPIQFAEDSAVLRYGWYLRVPAGVCCFIPAVIVVLAFVTDAKGEDVYAVLALVVFMSILVGLLVLEVFTVRVVVSLKGVESASPWRGRRFFRWEDIVDVRYLRTNFALIHADGRKIGVSLMLHGVGALVRAFRVHLTKVRYENAYQGIEWVEKFHA